MHLCYFNPPFSGEPGKGTATTVGSVQDGAAQRHTPRGITSSWPATGPEVAAALMHPGGSGQAVAGVPVCPRGVPQVLARGWRPQVSEARPGTVSAGIVCRAEGFPGRLERVVTLEVALCAWAAVGLPRSPGVVGPAPLPALRRGLRVPLSVWAVEPSGSGRTHPAIGPHAFPGRPFPSACLLVRSIRQPFEASLVS